MKPISPAEALNKAAAYCTLCERCISEVSKKLTTWGVSPAEQQRIIDRLQDEGFINEERYCRAFVNDKLRFNRWGRVKIRAALYEKQLPREYIAQAIEEIDDEEYMQTLHDIVATKQKIIRFAASRGFEPAKILQIVKCDSYEMDI